jgi:hypothetical protein
MKILFKLNLNFPNYQSSMETMQSKYLKYYNIYWTTKEKNKKRILFFHLVTNCSTQAGRYDNKQ